MRKLARCKIYRKVFGAKLKYKLIEKYYTNLRTLGIFTGDSSFGDCPGKFSINNSEKIQIKKLQWNTVR